MAESIWARIEIWPLPADLEALGDDGDPTPLAEALVDCEIVADSGGHGFHERSYTISDDPRRGRVLVFEDAGASNGLEQFRDVFPLLQELGIAYWAVDDGCAEIDGTEEAWTPGMEKPFWSLRLDNGGRVLSTDDFRRLTKAFDGDEASIGQAISFFFSFDATTWPEAEKA